MASGNFIVMCMLVRVRVRVSMHRFEWNVICMYEYIVLADTTPDIMARGILTGMCVCVCTRVCVCVCVWVYVCGCVFVCRRVRGVTCLVQMCDRT